MFRLSLAFAAALALCGCNVDAVGALSAIHQDLGNIEAHAATDMTAACAFAPILQADIAAVGSVLKLNAQQVKNINSAQAVITTACANPGAQNSAALVAKVGAAIAQVEAIQAGAAK
jgi:hypothetical protein